MGRFVPNSARIVSGRTLKHGFPLCIELCRPSFGWWLSLGGIIGRTIFHPRCQFDGISWVPLSDKLSIDVCCGHLLGRTSIFLATSLIIVQHRCSVTSLPFRLVVPPDCFCSPQYDSMKTVALSLGSSCVGLPSKAARQFDPSASKAHCCLLAPRPNAELRPNPLGKKHKLSVERATSWVWLLWRDERGPSRAQRREPTAAAAMCSVSVIP